MDIFGQFKAVTPEDVYDFYGIASLEIDKLDDDDRKLVECQLTTLQKTYMEALRKRFAHWAPNGGKALTVDDMINSLKASINEEIQKQTKKMAAVGAGFNIMETVKTLRGETGDARKKAEEASVQKFADNLSTFDSNKYPMIAKGVIALHEARTPQQIILAIDHINDLSHWGGAILVDFLSGKRDPSNKENNKIFNEIMETKKHAKSPLEYADRMTSDIRKLVQKNEKNRRAGIR